MNEKAQSEEFEDDDDVVDDDATLVGGEDKRKRSSPKAGDPAWRRLEKFREEKQTAELVSDFDDYDIDSEDDSGGSSRRAARHRAHG
jgi:hypothetical protein